MVIGEHDYKRFPELTNSQMESMELTSPHVQIKDDFHATVVRVVDGDTIRLRADFRDFDFPLRFIGVDAPEMSEGGEDAKEWLREQIEGTEVEIKIDRNNRVGKYGRLLGKVISLGMDMGETMLALGIVVPFGSKDEHKPPKLDKLFRMGQWF